MVSVSLHFLKPENVWMGKGNIVAGQAYPKFAPGSLGLGDLLPSEDLILPVDEKPVIGKFGVTEAEKAAQVGRSCQLLSCPLS